jgi:transmembrane sensor
VARLSGHPGEAVAPLRRVVGEHPGDSRAALAAFTLGRIQLDSLGQAAAAAQSFAQALSLGIAGPLVEDARARLVEAHARSGNRDAARSAAKQYEEQFPSGRHLAAVRRWAGD